MYSALVLLFAYTSNPEAMEIPPEMRAANGARAAIRTAWIEWSAQIDSDMPGDGERYFTSRIANADDLSIYHGLKDGRTLPDPSRIGKPYAYSEHRLLLKDGEQWSYDEENVTAQVSDQRDTFMPYQDLRNLGFEPTPTASHVAIWYRQPCERYSIERDAVHIMITGFYDQGPCVRWTLDPRKQMQPVRVDVVDNDEVTDSCETEYGQYDGMWFPQRAVFSHRGQVTMRLSVLAAEFNRNEHPQELTPNDIGLVPGMQIVHRGRRGPQAWTGTDIIPLEDYFALVKTGQADNSAFEALLERANSPTGLCRFPKTMDGDSLGIGADVKRKPALWEPYVRRFITFYRLDTDQIRKAWRHHALCVGGYYDYMKEHDAEIKKLKTDIEELTKKSERSKADDEALAHHRRRIDEIEGYAEKVFDERLRPGLLKIPSDKQVEAAKATAAQLKAAVEANKNSSAIGAGEPAGKK